MNNSDIESSYLDDYAHIEEEFEPPSQAELAWRRGKSTTKASRNKQKQGVQDLTEPEGLEDGFHTTYSPSIFERAWLLSSLRSFYEEQLIIDVLGLVKGGKEANVYRCKAHPTTGVELAAAKVYRPHMFRNLSNDSLYRQGRAILGGDGKEVKKNDDRVMRALGKKTAFGLQVAHTSWLMHEFVSMQRLYEAGAAVPKPFAANDNSVLMGYVGDEHMAAPTLNTVSLKAGEAKLLLAEVLRNVRLLLEHGLIHGDLSAYNLLYWNGEITLIDFPQVVDIYGNDHAHDLLRRDIERICDYFSRQGVECDVAAIVGDLWGSYVGARLKAQLADFSMWEYHEEARSTERDHDV